ncbi:MAG: hypothetical protein K8I82_11545 [Anaerolineae bacterium]|nr:hypothetical protein [Anaerolineae bacterium]
MAYNEAQKAVAVEIVNRHGGMTKHALAEITQALGKKVGRATIFEWVKAAKNTPNSENRTVQKFGTYSEFDAEKFAQQTLDNMFEAVARKYVTTAMQPDKVAEMDGKALVTAAAIAVDKMRLLRDLPTEIIAVLPSFIQALRSKGLDPATYMERTAQKLTHDFTH